VAKKKHPGGRPTVMTDEIIHKLEEAYALGCTDGEACFYADIAKSTLYKYQVEHPEFIERKESLKERPVLLARQAVLQAIQSGDSPGQKIAFDYLTKRKREEFADRVENTGKDGGPNQIEIKLSEEVEQKLREIYEQKTGA
jgi:hypothetical protein